MWGIDWGTLAAFCGVSTFLGGVAYRVLRGEFATKAEIGRVDERLAAVETRVASLATHGEVGALDRRVATIERDVAVVAAEMRGTKDGIGRVERQLSFISEYLMQKDKAQ